MALMVLPREGNGDRVRSGEIGELRGANINGVALYGVLAQGVVVLFGTVADFGQIGGEFLRTPHFPVGDAYGGGKNLRGVLEDAPGKARVDHAGILYVEESEDAHPGKENGEDDAQQRQTEDRCPETLFDANAQTLTSRGWTSIVSQPGTLRKTEFDVCRLDALATPTSVRPKNRRLRGALPSLQGLVLARGREMEVQLVDQQVHRNRVIHADFHDVVVGDDFDFFAFDGDLQIFHDLVDVVADLLFGVTVDDREASLFLHFVGELVLGHISGEDFIGNECAVDENGSPENRFDRAGSALRARRGTSVAPQCGVMYLSHILSRRRPERRFSVWADENE